MATSYSANQFDDAFRPKRLRSWEVPRFDLSSRPGPRSEAPRLTRSNTGAWGTFIGTWELPKRLPGNYIDDPMARDATAYDKLHGDFEEIKLRLTGSKFNYRARPRTLPPLTAADGLSPSAQRIGSGHVTPVVRDYTEGVGNDSGREQEIIGDTMSYNNKIPVPDLSGPLYIGGSGRLDDPPLAAM